MSSAPRTTTPSMSLLVSPASTSAFLIASSSSARELAPTWPRRLLPVPTIAYLSRSAVFIGFSRKSASRQLGELEASLLASLPDLQPFQARQHLVPNQRHLVDIVDQDDGHAVQAGLRQPQELLGDLVVAADHGEGGAARDHALLGLAHNFRRQGLRAAGSALGDDLLGGLPVTLLANEIVIVFLRFLCRRAAEQMPARIEAALFRTGDCTDLGHV